MKQATHVSFHTYYKESGKDLLTLWAIFKKRVNTFNQSRRVQRTDK